jgi:hypothetical protein
MGSITVASCNVVKAQEGRKSNWRHRNRDVLPKPDLILRDQKIVVLIIRSVPEDDDHDPTGMQSKAENLVKTFRLASPT